MEFSPGNPVVQLCLKGMALESKGLLEEATECFRQAWSEATYDFEKFITAHYLARRRSEVEQKLAWLSTMLEVGLRINDDSVRCALPALYADMAACYEALQDVDKARQYEALAASIDCAPKDAGPFFHGTKASLSVGELLVAGGNSNYQASLTMNHIYFTALASGAGLAAALAKGEATERVYVVEPTGAFEHDPNVTNQKFPGNPTRSYRSSAPLKIIGEVSEWRKLTPEALSQFRARVANNGGAIIN